MGNVFKPTKPPAPSPSPPESFDAVYVIAELLNVPGCKSTPEARLEEAKKIVSMTPAYMRPPERIILYKDMWGFCTKLKGTKMTDYRKDFVEPLYDFKGEQHPELASPGTFAHYQYGTQTTAIYPKDIAMPYLIAGLASEVGEVADKYKKAVRDGHPLDTEGFAKELGDVLWYVARLAAENGLSMEAVALGNLEKLRSRMERNKLNGSGDNR